MRQLRRLTGVATTTALICSGLALAVPTANAATPDTSTDLNVSYFRDLVLDQAHGHLFITSNKGLMVRTLEGAVVGTVANVPTAAGLALSADSTTLYVALPTPGAIAAISTSSLTETARYTVGDSTCPQSLAVSDGKLWFGYGCYPGPGALGVVDIAAEGSPVHLDQAPAGAFSTAVDVYATPALAGRVFTSAQEVAVWDTTGASPAKLAASAGHAKDMAFSPNGAEVVLSRTSTVDALSTTDLSLVRTHGSRPSGAQGVAVSSGGLVALGFGGDNNPDVRVHTSTGTLVRGWEFGAYGGNVATSAEPNGFAFDSTGSRLFAVLGSFSNEHNVLKVLHQPGSYPTGVTLTPPASATRSKPFSLHGKLTSGSPLPAGTALTVKRDGPGGTVTRPVVKTAADGSFTISDAVASRGTFGYTVAYAGNGNHQASSRRAVVNVVGTSTTVRILIGAGPYAYGARPVAVARLGTSSSKTVSIYFQDAAHSKPVLIKTGKVDSHGELRAAIYVRMRSNVYAVFSGDNVYNPVTSLQRITVRPHFVQTATKNYGTSGGYALFHHGELAHFDYAFQSWNGGTCVSFEVQQLLGGVWKASTTNSCIRIGYGTNGHLAVVTSDSAPAGYRYRVRATFLGDTYNVRQTNGWIYYRFT